ncbi:MAG: AbrB/MazE/SpoVT family DNA-binding domain-containing protein [Oscillospiraceae bacterium]|nr:AbrB/MazE/SpoVT family DNA-binding domain-containing protein [Oscillospiraceae bacterium]
MKSTGITRKVDELGRIVLPIELRRHLGIEEKSELEIFVEGSSIILQHSGQSCVFCGSLKAIMPYKGCKVCGACVRDLTKHKKE